MIHSKPDEHEVLQKTVPGENFWEIFQIAALSWYFVITNVMLTNVTRFTIKTCLMYLNPSSSRFNQFHKYLLCDISQAEGWLFSARGFDDGTIIIQFLDIAWIFKLARNYSNQLKFPMSMFYSSCSWKITTLWSSAIVLKASHSLNISLVIGTSCSCSGQYNAIRHSIFVTFGKEIMLLADRSL